MILRGFPCVLSVFSTWYTMVLVGLLHEECQRVISCVFSVNSGATGTWNVHNERMAHRWETKILRLTFGQKMQPGEELVTCNAPRARMQVENWVRHLWQSCVLKLCGRRGPCIKMKSPF